MNRRSFFRVGGEKIVAAALAPVVAVMSADAAEAQIQTRHDTFVVTVANCTVDGSLMFTADTIRDSMITMNSITSRDGAPGVYLKGTL